MLFGNGFMWHKFTNGPLTGIGALLATFEEQPVLESFFESWPTLDGQFEESPSG